MLAFSRHLTPKEQAWLASLRERFASQLYEHIYFRALKTGAEAGAAAKNAQERTILAFEKLAEEAMRVDPYRFKRQALFKDPDHAYAFLMKQSSWLLPAERAWIEDKAVPYFDATVWKWNRLKIPEDFREEAYQDVITKLMEYILLDNENFERLSSSEKALEKWLQATLSNDAGFDTLYRSKHHHSSGKLPKERRKRAWETPILTEKEMEAGHRGVSLDTVSGQVLTPGLACEDMSVRDEAAYQMILKESIEMQTVLYLSCVEGFSMEEIIAILKLDAKPAALYQRCRRTAEKLRRKLNETFPAACDDADARRWPPPDEKKGKKGT